MTVFILISSCAMNPMLNKSENQLRKVVADMQDKLYTQQEEIASLKGQIEETEHRVNKKIEENNENAISNYEVLKARVELTEKYQQNQNEINRRVVDAISKHENLIIAIDQNYENFRKDPPQDQVRKDIERATKLYEQKKYKEARDIYITYLDRPHLLTRNEYRVILYRVSLSEYRMHMNDESITHFSQLYEKFYREDDKYMASSLYHIGALLLRDGKCSEASVVYNQIKKEYRTHQYFYKMSNTRLNEIKTGDFCRSRLY